MFGAGVADGRRASAAFAAHAMRGKAVTPADLAALFVASGGDAGLSSQELRLPIPAVPGLGSQAVDAGDERAAKKLRVGDGGSGAEVEGAKVGAEAAEEGAVGSGGAGVGGGGVVAEDEEVDDVVPEAEGQEGETETEEDDD